METSLYDHPQLIALRNEMNGFPIPNPCNSERRLQGLSPSWRFRCQFPFARGLLKDDCSRMDQMASERTELKFSYDDNMHPIGATCGACGEKMPKPDPDLKDSADIIVWFSEKYIEHRRLKHTLDDRRRVPRE